MTESVTDSLTDALFFTLDISIFMNRQLYIDGRVEHYHQKSPNWNSEWTLCTHCTMGIGEKDGVFFDSSNLVLVLGLILLYLIFYRTL